MQRLQGGSGTATPQMGILSSKSHHFQEAFTFKSIGCVGQTHNDQKCYVGPPPTNQ
jgi:hypothetical protein